MANQRYFITCPVCRECKILGKSLGDGIYSYSVNLENIQEWMWKHMVDEGCHGDEWTDGILFTIEGERTAKRAIPPKENKE
jgi:hypothetical protein